MHPWQFIQTRIKMEQVSKSLSCMGLHGAMVHALNSNFLLYSICTCEQIKLHLLHMQKEVSNH